MGKLAIICGKVVLVPGEGLNRWRLSQHVGNMREIIATLNDSKRVLKRKIFVLRVFHVSAPLSLVFLTSSQVVTLTIRRRSIILTNYSTALKGQISVTVETLRPKMRSP